MLRRFFSLKPVLMVGSGLLAIALGVIISLVVIDNTKKAVIQSNTEKMQKSLEIKKAQLARYIDFRIKEMKFLAKSGDTLKYTKKLMATYNHDVNRKTDNAFPMDADYTSYNAYFTDYCRSYDFYDMFVIDIPHKHILYSVAKESDLQGVLTDNHLNNTKLAEVYNEVVKTNKPYLSDMGIYAPSNNEPAMFVGLPIHDESGKPIAVIAAQFSKEKITSLIDDILINWDDETYLIGKDHLPRSNNLVHTPEHLLQNAFADPSQGRIESEAANRALSGQKGTIISLDYTHQEVLSVYDSVTLQNIQWGIVNNTPMKNIHEEVREQTKYTLITIIISEIVAFFVIAYLIQISTTNIHLIWIKKGISQLFMHVYEQDSLDAMCDRALSSISRYIDAAAGALYLYQEDDKLLNLHSTYAFTKNEAFAVKIAPGEGLIGQVAKEMVPIFLKNIQTDQPLIVAAAAKTTLYNMYIYPIQYKNKLIGVVELTSYQPFDQVKEEYIAEVLEALAVTLFASIQADSTKELLQKTTGQKAELESQQEELQQSNVMLEEQQQQLETLSQNLQMQNEKLEQNAIELTLKASELEHSNQSKSEFLANMSHELRTPLNAIIILSKLLSEEDQNQVGAEVLKKAQVIHKSGNDLLFLINDILDLTKIDAGKMTLQQEMVATSTLVREITDTFNYFANDKGLKFTVTDNIQSTIFIDHGKLSQIVKNLLSNAFKFTEAGSITVLLEPDISNSDRIKFSVSDTGIGIPEDKQEIIFEAFRQVDGTTSRKYGGTGLGLSIVSKLVELMGGKISLQSKSDEGSTFVVTLPVSEVIGAPVKIKKLVKEETSKRSSIILEQKDDSLAPYRGNFANKSILIVDDDARTIFIITEIFKNTNAHMYNAFDGFEALEILQKEKIDLVLIDIMMPGMDGYTAIKKIRTEMGMVDLPIIAVTAKAMNEDKQKCLDAGANDYISKPVDMNALMMVAQGWLRRA